MTVACRVDVRPRHRNAGRPPEKSAPGFLQWIRGRACHLARQGGCSGRIRACHVDHAGDKGMGTKVADSHVVPMCDGHHAEQHRIGWTTFQSLYRFNAVQAAAEFWRAWPERVRWERNVTERASCES